MSYRGSRMAHVGKMALAFLGSTLGPLSVSFAMTANRGESEKGKMFLISNPAIVDEAQVKASADDLSQLPEPIEMERVCLAQAIHAMLAKRATELMEDQARFGVSQKPLSFKILHFLRNTTGIDKLDQRLGLKRLAFNNFVGNNLTFVIESNLGRRYFGRADVRTDIKDIQLLDFEGTNVRTFSCQVVSMEFETPEEADVPQLRFN